MACECENYACLNVVQQFNSCPTVLTLVLAATETGTWTWKYEFNGMYKGGTIDVTDTENIVLPWVFNEYYIHLIQFYKEDGTQFNNTCYRLDTSKIAGSYSTPSEAAEVSYLTVTLTDDMLSVNDDGEQVVSIAAIAGRDIILIADGNQIYNTGSFTQSVNSWTYTNGTVNYAGQILTILFG